MAAEQPQTGGPAGAPAATGTPLRVGLLLDDRSAPAWVHAALAAVSELPGVTWAVVVVRRDPQPRPGLLRRLWKRRRYLLYELYARLDRRFLALPPDAFATRDLGPLLAGVPVIEVTPRTGRHSDRLESADLQAIAAHRPDVLVRFGFRILRGEVLTLARHGVWSYHHDDNREIRGGPPGFWEVMQARPSSGAVLQVLSERLDGGRILARVTTPTDRRSVIRNRNHVYWTAAPLLARCLAHLADRGELPHPAGEDVFRPYDAPLYRKPPNLRATALLGRFAVRSGSDWLADRLSRRPWLLAYRFDAREETSAAAPHGEPPPPELFRFTPLIPPPDRFWADPYPFQRDGRWWVFFEECLFASGRRHVRVLELDPATGAAASMLALEAPFNLSHPVLVEWQGELYMVPECAATGQVRAWRCSRFPDRWEPAAVLLDDVAGLDATFHREGDVWWMFLNVAEDGASHGHDPLHVFWAPGFLGPWRPVAGNPVKVDGRSARPAGDLFRWRGELIRPAQDCGRRYGHSIVFHRVRRLSPDGYDEEAVSRLEPHWFPKLLATHTIHRRGPLTVVDGMVRRWPLGRHAAEGRYGAR